MSTDRPPLTEDRIRELLEAARARGDDDTAQLAHHLIWTLEFCDSRRDELRALATEVRRVFPILQITVDGDGGLVHRVTEPLRGMLEVILDGKVEEPTVRVEGELVIEKSHWGLRHIVQSLWRSVEGAPNFFECMFTVPEGKFVVTLQRPGGKSPATLLREAKEEVARLRDELERARRGEAP